MPVMPAAVQSPKWVPNPPTLIKRRRRDPKKKGNPKKLPKSLRKKASQLKKF